MYVCICNGYRESELRTVAREGAATAEDAYLSLGDGPCCGRCIPFAQEVVDSERQAVLREKHGLEPRKGESRDPGSDLAGGLPGLCTA
ncbi:MAG: (2Fe-2S)-binding protein [Rhodovibrionaceae bacterium]